MLSKLRSYRPSHATVVAYLALFVALGGTSYAAIKVTGKNVPKDALTGADIKNLTGADVKNNSLDGRDVKNLGASDFQGGVLPAGPQGTQGPKGDKGDKGVTDVVVRTATEDDSSASILCETGETVTGGGAYAIGGADSEVVGSYAFSFSPGTRALGWGADTRDATSTSVYVLCAQP